ncbi:AMP-binding protein [Aeromicrobium sp. Root344]|uniref:AMP-binding protein n=1 Tax=Aeromicrobium sp. Root344 TaxID=1736521 RepID=UPI0006FADCE8|nr:AMP-binding protein [Aeromicrobium sp. Root344]KQV75481.1 AMP-binding protein [Aeromicrobium sp. Root344]
MDLSIATGPTESPQLMTTIGANLVDTVARHGDREALVDCVSGRRWTYAELLAEVDAVALGLLELGVTKDDRVGIWAPNCPEWVFVQYATARIGAILVNVNPAYRSHELSFVVGQSGMRTIVAVPEFKGSSYAGMIAEAQAEHPSLVDVVLIGTRSWEQLCETGRGEDRTRLAEIESGLDAADPINIQYTSGTTGFPKGATLSHANILNNGWFVGELIDYTEEDRVCIPVPFYHCFGMVMGNLACTSHGAAMVIPAPAFDPVATLEAVADERCTSLYGVPTMFIAMLDQPIVDTLDLTSLRTGIMAGSPCPVETMKQVIGRLGMTEVSICYGMTETSPVSTQTRTDDSLERRVSTVGRVGPHLEVKIADPGTGEVLPRGEAGELCTRGYSVMLGYWDQPDKTAEAIDADGWMRTGDLGVMDADGYVTITGRIKDMVIRGGENIYPREIEEFLMTHPDVLDAQVIGVPDDKYGEELMAWLRLRDGAAPIDAPALREFCSGKLAHYKIPPYVHVVDEFPMTVTGKVRKVEMRKAAAELLADRG